jgi:hypothetical protein
MPFSTPIVRTAPSAITRLACAGLVVLGAVVPASSASAWTTLEGVGDPQTAALYRQWQAASQIPTANVTVSIAEHDCTAAGSIACIRGCRTGGRMTLVFADPRWLWREPDTPERVADRLSVRATFYHELAHLRDCQTRRSHAYRKAFARTMGWSVRSDLPKAERRKIDDDVVNVGLYERWGVCVNTTPTVCVAPREIFAMAGAWCSLDRASRPTGEWASGYGYAPTAAQHRAACELLRAPLR